MHEICMIKCDQEQLSKYEYVYQWKYEARCHCPKDPRKCGVNNFRRNTAHHTQCDGDCQNDAARAIAICWARKGTIVKLFDQGDIDPWNVQSPNDDWLWIKVKRTFPKDHCEILDTLESNYESDYLDVKYFDKGNLNGKVSGMIIDASGTNIR